MSGYNFNAPVYQIFTVNRKTTTLSSPISLPSNESRTSSSYFIVIVISVICAVILITCAVLLFFCRKQKQKGLEKQKVFEKQKDKTFEMKELPAISIKNENQFASGRDMKPPTVFNCQLGCIYTTKEDKLFKKHKDAHETQSLLNKAFCTKCSFKAENKEAITFHLNNNH